MKISQEKPKLWLVVTSDYMKLSDNRPQLIDYGLTH